MSDQIALSELKLREIAAEDIGSMGVGTLFFEGGDNGPIHSSGASSWITFVPFGNYEDHVPTRVSARLLEIKGNVANLAVEFTHGSERASTNPPQTKAELDLLLKDEFNKDAFKGRKPMGPRPPVPPIKDRETSLSLASDEWTLVIIRLPHNAKYQFNRRGAPFSAIGEHISRFGETGKLDTAGNIISQRKIVEKDRAGNEVIHDGCKTAYFVIKGMENTITPFNVHLDIVGKHSTGEDYHIPIIVDPDVRHPGGNGDP